MQMHPFSGKQLVMEQAIRTANAVSWIPHMHISACSSKERSADAADDAGVVEAIVTVLCSAMLCFAVLWVWRICNVHKYLFGNLLRPLQRKGGW